MFHDCRQDSDALAVKHKIQLRNVHDTQAVHCLLNNIAVDARRPNLNELLNLHGFAVPARDNSVYMANPEFWSVRPLTSDMIERAASDVALLLRVRNEQRTVAGAAMNNASIEASNVYLEELRSRREGRVLRIDASSETMARIVGKGGARIRQLSTQTGVSICSSQQRPGVFRMVASTKAQLNNAERRIKSIAGVK